MLYLGIVDEVLKALMGASPQKCVRACACVCMHGAAEEEMKHVCHACSVKLPCGMHEDRKRMGLG